MTGMTNPTLERAARAVRDATSGELTDGQNLRIARAVLMAVREPDEKLVEAMNASAAFHVCLEHHAQTDARMWRAGVDAILNDGEANG